MKKICTPSSAALVSIVLLAHGGLGYFLHTMRLTAIHRPKPPIIVALLPDVAPKPLEMGEETPAAEAVPAPKIPVVRQAAPPRSRPIVKPLISPAKPVVIPVVKLVSVEASKSTVVVPSVTSVVSPKLAVTEVTNNTPVAVVSNVSTGTAKDGQQDAPAPKPPAAKIATGETSQASFGAAYLNNPKPIYPPLSRAREEEGTVRLRVFVSAMGNANSVEIAQSSGFSALDRAAKSAVERWKFVPAKRNGENVEGIVIVPMPFKLEN